jgi:hypothetical protein
MVGGHGENQAADHAILPSGPIIVENPPPRQLNRSVRRGAQAAAGRD